MNGLPHPIAVTGWAWRTPLGDGVDEVVRRLAGGERAAAPLARFPSGSTACHWAAAIAGEPAPSRHHRFLRRMGGFALDVALEAPARCRPPPAARASGCSSATAVCARTGTT